MRTDDLKPPKVIPALRREQDWELLPVNCSRGWVFFLGGSIESIGEPTAILQRRGWKVFVHLDMLHGISHDVDGLRFLKNYAGPDGIISTHSQTILSANRAGLLTIQRIFLLDSQSVQTGIAQVKTSHPDALETLPGLMPDIVHRLIRRVSCPVIVGGLITKPEHIDQLLTVGASGVSTSTANLWQYQDPL